MNNSLSDRSNTPLPPTSQSFVSKGEGEGRRSYSVWIWIVLIAVVFVSIAGRWIFSDSARARWILAYAANEFTSGRVTEAKEALDRALEVSPDIALDKDYWRVRFDILDGGREASAEAREALEASMISTLERLESVSDRARVAMLVCDYLMEKRRFKQAITIMEAGFPPMSERAPELNNQIAYTRALAKSDLDKALEEVNSALQKEQNSSIIDTKAWVLHQMSDNERAIEFANVAIEKFYRDIYQQLPLWHAYMLPDEVARVRFGSKLASRSEEVTGETKPMDEFGESEKALGARSESELNALGLKDLPRNIDTRLFKQALKQMATLRFHRACILDALGKRDEAFLDYYWLDHFGYTDTDSLL